MGRKNAVEWNYIGYDLVVISDAPYYLAAFTQTPQIEKRPLPLASGDILHPGDTVAYLGSHKTSAGFENLHPVSPTLFRYLGVANMLDQSLVIWQPEVDGVDYLIEKNGYSNIYYAHSFFESGGVTKLVFANRTGAGRLVETDRYYATHNEVPVEYYPKEYAKKMGWVA